MDEARQVRDFWFGSGRPGIAIVKQHQALWFGAETPEQQQVLDERIRQRFGALFERASQGELDSWADGTRRRLSLILLLDQFSRNLHRGTGRAFENDPQALALVLSGMQSGADAALDPLERIFFYMPLQHAESLEVQDESVAAYRLLVSEGPEELRATFENCLEYARKHHEVIRRFGRFPHRNALLERPSTAEESAYLAAGADRFGQ